MDGIPLYQWESRQLWRLQDWKYWKPSWMWPWERCSSRRPMGGGLKLNDLQGTFQPIQTILWFHAYILKWWFLLTNSFLDRTDDYLDFHINISSVSGCCFNSKVVWGFWGFGFFWLFVVCLFCCSCFLDLTAALITSKHCSNSCLF